MLPSTTPPPSRATRSAWRRALARTATAATLPVTTFLLVLAVGGTGVAQASAGPRFVPEATSVTWDSAVVTVTFQEVEVDSDATVISFAVTADVEVVCTRGESTIVAHRSAKATDVYEYPVSEDGTVEGVAELPLEVKKPVISGYSCKVRDESVTVVLEDFLTGASLVHQTDPRPNA